MVRGLQKQCSQVRPTFFGQLPLAKQERREERLQERKEREREREKEEGEGRLNSSIVIP